jgi:hypothetical protein
MAKLEVIKETLEALADMYQNGQIESHDYYKGLIHVAFELQVEGLPQKAHEVLMAIDPAFFTGPCEYHMANDPVFADVCLGVAQRLVKMGAVELDGKAKEEDGDKPPFSFPQGPASA